MPPSRPLGGDLVRAVRGSPRRRVGRLARVGVAARGSRRPAPPRGVGRGGTGTASLTAGEVARARRATCRATWPSTTAVSGEPSPGGKCSFEHFGAAAGVGRPGLALAEADRAVVDEVAERRGRGARRGRRRRSAASAAARPARDAVPAAATPRAGAAGLRRGQNARSPSTASRAGSRVKRGEQHHRDADRQDRAEPVGRLEVGDEQHQHRRDHGRPPRRRSPARSRRSACGSAASRRVAGAAAPRGSGGRAAASSRCRRRR